MLVGCLVRFASILYIMTFFRFALLLIPAVLSSQVSDAQVFFHLSERGGKSTDVALGITQDREGFIWFATTYGLLRYDSRSIKRYLHDPFNKGSLHSNYLSTILCDSQNRIWLGSWKGLALLNREKETFTNFRHDLQNPASIGNDTVYCFFEDRRKRLWVGTQSGLDLVLDEGERVEFRHFSIDERDKYANVVRAIADDKNGDLWLGTSGGLVRLRDDGSSPERFLISPESQYPQENDVVAVYCSGDGKILLGTRAGGMSSFDPVTRRFEGVSLTVGERGRNPVISGFYPDKQGKLWIPTWEGLACYDPAASNTTWYVNEPANPSTLTDNTLFSGYIDRQQGLWLGSYNGGIDYLYVSPRAFRPLFSPDDGKLAERFIDGWYGMGAENTLWSISENMDLLLLFDEKRRVVQSHKLGLPSSMRFNRFFLDAGHVLWCGGSSVLSRLDLKTGKRDDYPFFESIGRRGAIRGILDIGQDKLLIFGSFGTLIFDKQGGKIAYSGLEKVIISALRDSRGNIWLGGKGEVSLLRKDNGAAETFRADMSEEIVNNDIWRISEDSQGRIWFVAGLGLWLFDEQSRKFLLHSEFRWDDFLTDVMCDEDGFLWLSAGSKLIRFHPEKKTTQYFGEADGLPNRAMLRVDAAFRNREGMFFFPTNKGAFVFRPGDVTFNDTPEGIVVSSLKLFNQKIELTDSTGIFKREISTEKELFFRHDQNIFTLDFAHLSYFKSEQNQYAYRLEGFEKDWNYVDIPTATYTSLPAGQYTFMVKAANGDGFWNPEALKLRITVLPPWWRAWYAFLFYGLLLAGIVYTVSRFFWLKRVVKQENELYHAKLDFFTNISHEIRTHLSLIGGPLEKACDSVETGSEVSRFLTYAKNNTNRLMRLVNELLDFRKMQNGKIRLHVSEQDLAKMLKNTLAAFEHMASEKGIDIRLQAPDHPVVVWLDVNQIQKVFYNLLSNAFKFTPEGGIVSIVVAERDGEALVEVRDNGPGIAPQYLDHLFTNFFQVYENSRDNTGYGIGLALSKEIVMLHKGELSVTSRLSTEAGEGETCFTVVLLKGKSHFPEDDIRTSEAKDFSGSIPAIHVDLPTGDGVTDTLEKHTLLIIEDNDELRSFGVEVLRNNYQVLEADNGRKGLALAREQMPDLIICDVMMPEMNGLEVCKELRSDFPTRHIPIILMSARSTTQQMVEGFQAGADAYLIKPFDFRLLELQIANLIRMREELMEKNSRAVLLEPGELVLDNPDEEFIARLRDLVIENISDAGFGVNEMAHQTGMSVSVLYRKLRALTGMTVNEFSKGLRMKRAMQLLERGIYNVNEVANMVGFDDSKYFSKEFRKTFGKNPSEIKRH